jgi:hypothetical protein
LKRKNYFFAGAHQSAQRISGECIGKPYDSFVGKGLVCAYKRAQAVYDPAKIKVKQ